MCFFVAAAARGRKPRVVAVAAWPETAMTRDQKPQRVERLRARLGALRSRMALLPRLAQTEFRPLVDDLEAQLELAGRERGGVRRLLDEIRAIDKCVSFELAVSL